MLGRFGSKTAPQPLIHSGGVTQDDTPKQVLIAEDAVEVAELLAARVGELIGCEVVGIAHDGDEALDLFATHSPEIAIVELQMPGTRGLDVVRAMRGHSPSMLVIVWTMLAGEDYETISRQAGADYFVSKIDGIAPVLRIVQSFVAQ